MKRNAGGFMQRYWWTKRHWHRVPTRTNDRADVLSRSVWLFNDGSHKKKTQPSESRNIAWKQMPHSAENFHFQQILYVYCGFPLSLSRKTFSAQKYNTALCWANHSILKENRSATGYPEGKLDRLRCLRLTHSEGIRVFVYGCCILTTRNMRIMVTFRSILRINKEDNVHRTLNPSEYILCFIPVTIFAS